MPWYRVGTVAITAGQTTVTGTGTNFSANGRVGDAFLGPDGRWHEVTNIASGTVLSILPAYQGATVSGGTYALAPMQGYNKTLTDAVNGMVNQWGATLAGLGAVSTENVVPVAKGGTGGATPALARAGLQLGSAAVAAIVGTVSQAGGVPTGAIIERGSNGNGDYVKYADGTMICWQYNRATVEIPIATSFFGGFRSSDITFNFPATFSEAPSVQATTATCFGVLPYQSTTGAFVCNFLAVASQASAARNVKWIATGRWF
ncbi:phage tail protein [Pseudomonas plecoglossicida]|uniref:phage tail protein n=1 Tax=Pseudomonas plecoglossicida TaxID=70775 RepID=UPI0015E2BCB3|nr:phage tail protein [Pseudomonas plecoglossicida]MBA1195724.1 phage tail protein [Pseudomonas plecoglossicida]